MIQIVMVVWSTSFDIPALRYLEQQAIYTFRRCYQNGIGDRLYKFDGISEWNGPDSNDSDSDAITFNTILNSGQVVSHDRDWNLSDGREVFKYGTNPMDNDTDGDMLLIGMSTKKAERIQRQLLLQIKNEVQWIDPATGGSCTCQQYLVTFIPELGTLSRPDLGWTWATFDPRDP